MAHASSSPSPQHDERPWMHGTAGVLGGSLAMMTFYPLDFLRTRMHTLHQGNHTMPLRSAAEIVRQEGLRGMYRGMAVSVVSHSVGWGAYLLTFRSAQKRIEESMDRYDAQARRVRGSFLFEDYVGHSSRDFLAACCAATFTGTLITPLHVMKTRRQLCDVTKTAGRREKVTDIVRREGWRAMFRGLGPQILLTGNTTIQVTIYEWFRRNCFTDHEDPSSLQVAMASAFSKAVACALFNPLEVVRTRLQAKSNYGNPNYRSMSAGLQTIYRGEGFAGLYRALPVNVMRVIPSTVAAFVLYEKCLWAIRSTHNAVTSGSVRGRISYSPSRRAERVDDFDEEVVAQAA